jgi:oligosaccharide translocation protein RFT1
LHLCVLLHVVTLVGLTLLCFGPAYSFVFLDLLYGSRWSNADTGAPAMLSFYCVYILFMALNGVSEAFVSATISTRQLRHYNLWLVACSAAYVAACAALLRFGTAGLIAANCANMALRIAYSAWFIRRFFAEQKDIVSAGLDDTASAASDEATKTSQRSPSLLDQLQARALALPSAATFAAFAVSVIVTQASFVWFDLDASGSDTDTSSLSLVQKLRVFGPHIGVGVACLALVGGAVVRTERAFLAQLAELAGARRKRKQA